MTARARAVLVGACVLLLVGLLLRWPELTGLGAAAFLLVVCVQVAYIGRPRVGLCVSGARLVCRRGEPLALQVSVSGVRRSMHWRGVRLVEGELQAPVATFALPPGERTTVILPVDSSRRGLQRVGPLTVVLGDPWGLVQRVLAREEGAWATVRPRSSRPVAEPSRLSRGAAGPRSQREPGQDQFWTLRDYVLGDEPRSIHWRSSARVGRLVVRQDMTPRAPGVLVVLDVDATAYGSGVALGGSWEPERFEQALELAAGVLESEAGRGSPVWLTTTHRQSTPLRAHGRLLDPLLDALALADVAAPVSTSPETAISGRTAGGVGRLLVVSGAPSARVVSAARKSARRVDTRLLRVAAPAGASRSDDVLEDLSIVV